MEMGRREQGCVCVDGDRSGEAGETWGGGGKGAAAVKEIRKERKSPEDGRKGFREGTGGSREIKG